VNPSLNELRDIHLPAPVSWWPPATGWWALIVIAVVAGIAVLVWSRLRRRNRWRRHALKELSQLRHRYSSTQSAPESSVRALSSLLRRIAISRFPRKDVAALNGDAWLAFLDEALGHQAAFRSGHGSILAVAPYARETGLDSEAIGKLFDLGELWLKKLPGGGRK